MPESRVIATQRRRDGHSVLRETFQATSVRAASRACDIAFAEGLFQGRFETRFLSRRCFAAFVLQSRAGPTESSISTTSGARPCRFSILYRPPTPQKLSIVNSYSGWVNLNLKAARQTERGRTSHEARKTGEIIAELPQQIDEKVNNEGPGDP